MCDMDNIAIAVRGEPWLHFKSGLTVHSVLKIAFWLIRHGMWSREDKIVYYYVSPEQQVCFSVIMARPVCLMGSRLVSAVLIEALS